MLVFYRAESTELSFAPNNENLPEFFRVNIDDIHIGMWTNHELIQRRIVAP